MIRNVVIDTVHPKKMRYRTVGDWYFPAPGYLRIQIADSGKWYVNMLVAIHELIEVVLCTHRGITQKRVDRFDFAHQDDEDAGSHPRAPYHDQHMIAMGVEMIVSVAIGLKWRKYEELLDRTVARTPKKGK